MIAGELITALTLGLIGGVIPGPVLTAIFTEILQAGYRRAHRIVFYALFIETMVAVASLLLLSSLGLEEGIFRGISLAGAAVLLWIAFSLWKVRAIDTGEQSFFSLWKITLMILSNGVLWTYWITICIPKAMLLSEQVLYGEYMFMGMVQLGWLISTLVVTFLFSRFRRSLSQPRLVPVVFKIFSVVFIYFAVNMIYQSVRYFIG